MSILTVSSLNEKIKAILEATFMHVMVEGEVGSVTYHSSGHLYFSLKDEYSTIKCVMWKSNVKKLKFKLEQGEHIVVDASLGVYSPRGEYQLIATNIEPYGKGALALAFEQLKKKLEKKGYFDDTQKKPLPKFPKNIAIITALNGAALQDMLKVANKRWRLTKISVIDVLVQGESASKEIAKAIEYANKSDFDIIIIARGGGSQEDLWAFNEEIVADAIYYSKIPIVSAIGHEVDFLISDFVADLRAPTPSAAMEIVLPDSNEYLMMLDELNMALEKSINLKLLRANEQLSTLKQQLKVLSPIDKLNLIYKEFETLKYQLNSQIEHKFRLFSSNLEPLNRNLFNSLEILFKIKEGNLKNLQEQLTSAIKQKEVQAGFVEVIKDKKRVNICELNLDDEFTLVSNSCKLEVKAKTTPIKL